MEIQSEVIIAALGVMVVSLGGVIFWSHRAKHFVEKRLPYLISFSAGVFLVTAGILGFEVFDIAPNFLTAAVFIALGYLLAWGLQWVWPEVHHHHNDDCGVKKQGARKLILGDALHNVTDGIVLVSAFAVSSVAGVVATVSIMIHEFLQELSEYFVLRAAGYPMSRALLINFSVSATVLIGVVLGYVALMIHDLEVFLLALSAGFFLHVVLHDLLPRPDHHETRQGFLWHVTVLFAGVCLMGLINILLGDTHEHDHEVLDSMHEEALHHDEH
jgi:zinc and cadmium transporter